MISYSGSLDWHAPRQRKLVHWQWCGVRTGVGGADSAFRVVYGQQRKSLFTFPLSFLSSRTVLHPQCWVHLPFFSLSYALPSLLPAVTYLFNKITYKRGLPQWLSLEGIHLQCRRHRRHEFNLWVRKIPGVGNGYPLQFSYLILWTVESGGYRHGVAKSWAWLSTWHILIKEFLVRDIAV